MKFILILALQKNKIKQRLINFDHDKLNLDSNIIGTQKRTFIGVETDFWSLKDWQSL